MDADLRPLLEQRLQEIRDGGLYKEERVIQSPQGASIRVEGRSTLDSPAVAPGPSAGTDPGEGGRVPAGEVLNFCANNYLGLSSHPDLIAAAHRALDLYGYGLSSVRFICGTQTIHKDLETAIARFLGTDDAVLYSSCFDANGGLFETLLGEEDAVISDELNHASIIDGVRLCKAQRHRYKNADLADLEACLQKAAGARIRMIATDGVFSMDGTLAPLDRICELADRHRALVMVDDSHATGIVGKTGRGTPERFGVQGRVDVITSTLGKALGGAAGGFTAGRREIVEILRQRSRPYLFSNTLPPMIAAGALKALDLLSTTTDLRDRLETNVNQFREWLPEAGFRINPGDHPIVPVMLGDAKIASGMARDLLAEGIYVVGFSHPVVPPGKARIRVQISAAHTPTQIDRCVVAFTKVGRKYGVIG